MLDPIASIWVLLWLSISSYGCYIILTQDKNAAKFYVYGKSLNVQNTDHWFWKLFLVPKSYFRHFYVTSSILFTACLIGLLLHNTRSPIGDQLDWIMATYLPSILQRHSLKLHSVTTLEAISGQLFIVTLMMVQSYRRLYESFFVSVYSNKSKINLIHYAFGHVFYGLAALSTLAPILLSQSSQKFTFDKILNQVITKPRAIAFILFIYLSMQQHRCHIVLANLRKDKTGRVITDKYFVPSGGLFEFVSCPHHLLEVLLYLIIATVQSFDHPYWNLIFLLVLSTQVINAQTEHKWYKRKYKDYPKQRKAIVPMLL